MYTRVIHAPRTVGLDGDDIDEFMIELNVLRRESLTRPDRLRRRLVEARNAKHKVELAGRDCVGVEPVQRAVGV